MADRDLIELATQMTAAWLANPNTRTNADEIPPFLKLVHDTLSTLDAPTAPEAEETTTAYEPATTARRSLASPDRIISMIDGKPYSSLTRHLKRHGLTPAEYRARYGLKSDYPMIAQGYSEARRAIAKTIGLGRKAGKVADADAAATKPARGIAAAKRAAKAHLGDTGE